MICLLIFISFNSGRKQIDKERGKKNTRTKHHETGSWHPLNNNKKKSNERYQPRIRIDLFVDEKLVLLVM